MADQFTASARAYSNIALIKYWGKRDESLNLPAVGSLSLTLSDLYSDTRVRFDPDLTEDLIALDDEAATAAPGKFSRFLDLVRQQSGMAHRAHIHSHNNFPTAAGLASSASGFAALALAATRAAGLELSPRELSILARQGSGSAARSIFGGLVLMHRGEREDGQDAYAEPICPSNAWPLHMTIGVVDTRRKRTGSTQGMRDSAASAPFYTSWVESSAADLEAGRQAVKARDFTRLGELAEHSCLKMHGLMLATRPGLIYWQGPTVAAMHAIRALRAQGTEAYFTIDAGPQIKVLHQPADQQAVADCLRAVDGIREIRATDAGPDAHPLP